MTRPPVIATGPEVWYASAMGIYTGHWKGIVLRILLASPFFAMGMWLMYMFHGLGIVFAVPFLFIGAVILAPRIGSAVAEPFGSLLYPRRHASGPSPMYGIPQSRRAKGLYEESFEEYEKIIAQYPTEVKPYLEMIDIALLKLRDVPRAEIILQRGLATFRDPAIRQVLHNTFEASKSRLEPLPAWAIAEQKRVLHVPHHEHLAPVPEPDGLNQKRYHPGGFNQA